MSDPAISYALLVNPETDAEVPCHISEIKKGDRYYLVSGSAKSDLKIATDDAFESFVNNKSVWSIPNDKVT